MATQFYYQTKQWDQQRLLRIFCVVNMLFAIVVLMAWPFIGAYIVEPTATTTGQSLSSSRITSVLDYPYVLLWSAPIGAVIGAWISHNLRYFALARYIAIYPILLFALAYVWHHFGDGVALLVPAGLRF